MASNLLNTFEKIERGRQKCIAKANEKNYQLPEDASLEKIANCIDSQIYLDEYLKYYKALISGDYSNVENGELRVPSDITEIESYAFYNKTNLEKIILPENITNIKNYAFGNCSNLTGVINLPFIKSIQSYAFANASSTAKSLVINIGSSLETMNNQAFANTYGTINYDGRVAFIPQSCFDSSNATLNFTDEAIDAITSIGQYAFRQVGKIEKSFIGKNVKGLGLYSFSNVTIPEHVVVPEGCTMANCVFYSATLEKGITLPESLTDIPEYTFYNATVNQEELIIPKNVNSVNSYAFQSIRKAIEEDNLTVDLPRLIFLNEEKITFKANVFQYARINEVIFHAQETASSHNAVYNSQYIKNFIFLNLKSGVALTGSTPFNTTGLKQGGIYIPDDLVDEYKTASGWSTYASYIKPLSSWSGYEEYMASLEVSE